MNTQNQKKKKKTISNPQQKTKAEQRPRKTFAEQIDDVLKHRITTVILLVIISLVFFSNFSAIFDQKVDLNGDNIVYFSCGKALAAGKGFTSIYTLDNPPQTHFPPGYPLFIAALQSISPDNIIFVKEVNGALLWLSLLLLFWLVRRVTKNTPVAFCTALFTAIQSNMLSFATIMMSEMLFIFISLIAIHLAIYLNEKLFLKKGRWKVVALFVLFLLSVVYTYFVRTMGFSLVLALILWFGVLALQSFFVYYRNKKSGDEMTGFSKTWLVQRILICLLIAASFFTAQTLWGIRQANAGQISSDYKTIFLSKPKGEVMATWTDWKERIEYNVSGNIAKWVPNVLFGAAYNDQAKITGAQWIRGFLILAVFVCGLFCLKRKTFWLLFLYLLISMGVLVFFPEQYQGSRYLIPLIPFFIFLFFNGIANIAAFICNRYAKKIKPLVLQFVLLIVCAFWLYPIYTNAQSSLRAKAQIESWDDVQDPRIGGYLAACEFCRDSLSDSIRVIARKPEIFYMFSGYKKSTTFPWYAKPDTIMAFLKKERATHVILDNWYPQAYPTLYPAIQANQRKFKVLKMFGKVDAANHLSPTYVLEFNDDWGFHGKLVNGLKTGEGYELFQNGRKYVGNYENNVFNGYGILYGKDGKAIYNGNWRNGVFINGEGELNFTNGNVYIGKIDNNMPDGNGAMYDKSGKILNKGEWHNGAFVKAD